MPPRAARLAGQLSLNDAVGPLRRLTHHLTLSQSHLRPSTSFVGAFLFGGVGRGIRTGGVLGECEGAGAASPRRDGIYGRTSRGRALRSLNPTLTPHASPCQSALTPHVPPSKMPLRRLQRPAS
jgi:hypothetical protein